MANVIDLRNHFTQNSKIELRTQVSSRQALDRNQAVSDLRDGKDWHTNVVRVVASCVASGWPDEAILAYAEDWRLNGYTQEETQREVTTAILGARNKGYGPVEENFPNTSKTSEWPSAFTKFDARDIPRRKKIYGEGGCCRLMTPTLSLYVRLFPQLFQNQTIRLLPTFKTGEPEKFIRGVNILIF